MLTPISTAVLIDGELLVRSRRYSAAHFRKLVDWYHQRGVTDAGIVQAMANARGVISPGVLGGRR